MQGPNEKARRVAATVAMGQLEQTRMFYHGDVGLRDWCNAHVRYISDLKFWIADHLNLTYFVASKILQGLVITSKFSELELP